MPFVHNPDGDMQNKVFIDSIIWNDGKTGMKQWNGLELG